MCCSCAWGRTCSGRARPCTTRQDPHATLNEHLDLDLGFDHLYRFKGRLDAGLFHGDGGHVGDERVGRGAHDFLGLGDDLAQIQGYLPELRDGKLDQIIQAQTRSVFQDRRGPSGSSSTQYPVHDFLSTANSRQAPSSAPACRTACISHHAPALLPPPPAPPRIPSPGRRTAPRPFPPPGRL